LFFTISLSDFAGILKILLSFLLLCLFFRFGGHALKFDKKKGKVEAESFVWRVS
jgi:hypothetical protein